MWSERCFFFSWKKNPSSSNRSRNPDLQWLLQWNLDIAKCQGTEKKNGFALTRFRYIKVLFHIFYYYWGKENHSLHRGLRYIEVRYIEFLYIEVLL